MRPSGEHVDLAAIKAAAAGGASPGAPALPPPPGQRIALARDAAFSSPIRICWTLGAHRGPRCCPSPLADEPPPEAIPAGCPAATPSFTPATGRRQPAPLPVCGISPARCMANAAATWCWAADRRFRHAPDGGLLGLVTSYESAGCTWLPLGQACLPDPRLCRRHPACAGTSFTTHHPVAPTSRWPGRRCRWRWRPRNRIAAGPHRHLLPPDCEAT